MCAIPTRKVVRAEQLFFFPFAAMTEPTAPLFPSSPGKREGAGIVFLSGGRGRAPARGLFFSCTLMQVPVVRSHDKPISKPPPTDKGRGRSGAHTPQSPRHENRSAGDEARGEAIARLTAGAPNSADARRPLGFPRDSRAGPRAPFADPIGPRRRVLSCPRSLC